MSPPHHAPGGGTAQRCRLRGVGAGFLVLASIVTATACTADPNGEAATSTADQTAQSSAPTMATDPGTRRSCRTFWGDPDYTGALSRDVLDRAATAPEAGPEDPEFYAQTGDDVERAFADAPAVVQRAAAPLARWMHEQPERGKQADLAAFRTGWEGLATACASTSPAAAWTVEDGEQGTKPAALVCADVFDTPQTLTVFANANVLTSNMFHLVGRSPRTVPAQKSDEVQETADYLATEIQAVDDDAVRAALRQVRDPFQDALDGDLQSAGLQQPLEKLGAACGDVGYDAGTGAAPEDGEDDGGLV